MGAVICLDLFIKRDKVPMGPITLHGDGDAREFSSDSDPSASRGYIYIPVDDPSKANDPEYQHMNPTGYISPKYTSVGIYGGEATDQTDWEGPSNQNKWSVTPGQNGDIKVAYDLVLGGGLEYSAPHINGNLTFSPDGNGGYTAHGERDGFPWAESYYYDGQGNAQTIFQRNAIEGNPTNLDAIENNTGFLLHDFAKFFIRAFNPQKDEIGGLP
jgi:hypothetical protein